MTLAPPTEHGYFTPARIGRRTLPSRVILAPINTGFASGGLPDERLIAFHAERSGRFIGISMVGNVAIDPFLVTNEHTAVLDTETSLHPYRRIAETIQANGSLAGIQLAACPAGLNPSKKWRPPNLDAEAERLGILIQNLSDSTIRLVLKRFVEGIRLAQIAGFDVIQIHAAHGYFLALMLSPWANRRTGVFAYASPWFDDFVAEARDASSSSLLSVRISVLSGWKSQADIELAESKRRVESLAVGGVDLVDLSTGFYTLNRHLIYPTNPRGAETVIRMASDLAPITAPTITLGGGFTELPPKTTIPPNSLLSIGRALIADPQFPKRAAGGFVSDTRTCARTNRCHYSTRGRNHIECGVNESLGGTASDS